MLSILSLAVLVAFGLVIYYQSIYVETPLPVDVVPLPKITSPSSVSDKPVLLPIPKKLEWKNGSFDLPASLSFYAAQEDEKPIQAIFKNRFGAPSVLSPFGTFRLTKNKKLPSQAYLLSVQPSVIIVEYGDLQGLFYALTTVKQLAKQSNNKVPCVHIEDRPDLATRGLMLDISRGKVPTLQTLYGMVDFLADLKYNHLELYIEGFSFGYPSFKNLWEKTETPITPEEIQQLDRYCKERFIELVPNQNSLGHMDAWLATEEYKSLAECPDGYKFMGLVNMKTTLAPANPKSLELVTKMSEDLLPNFSSNQFNVNLDEPFELGKNKEHPIDDPKEVAKVYLDYAKRLNDYVKSKGKKMMMWGDVVSRNPEFVAEIPKDITLLEWRYESFQEFEKICKIYKDAGLNYMVCPGTSSWTSFTGRTDNMMLNIENAVSAAVNNGAEGMLITDWGDTPHLQYLTVSYPGLAYGAALSWNSTAESKGNLSSYLSNVVFQDSTNQMGDVVLELGRYWQFEEYPMLAGTMTGWAYRFGMIDKNITEAIFKKFQNGIMEFFPPEEGMKEALANRFGNPKIYNAKAIIDFVEAREKELLQTKLNAPDGPLVLAEYKNAIRMIKLGAMLKQFNNYHLQQTDEENKKLLTKMESICASILSEHEYLWMSRNKQSGYEQSTETFKAMQSSISENLDLLDKNFITRSFSRTKDKIITAAAVLFLR